MLIDISLRNQIILTQLIVEVVVKTNGKSELDQEGNHMTLLCAWFVFDLIEV